MFSQMFVFSARWPSSEKVDMAAVLATPLGIYFLVMQYRSHSKHEYPQNCMINNQNNTQKHLFFLIFKKYIVMSNDVLII